jgi:hypothetical protein
VQYDLPVSQEAKLVAARRQTGLPAILRKSSRRAAWRLRTLVALVINLAGGGGAYYWWQLLDPPLPPSIAFGNGRLEANFDFSSNHATIAALI